LQRRLYFYGKDWPIHVNYGSDQKSEYIELVMTETDRQMPRKRNYPLIYL